MRWQYLLGALPVAAAIGCGDPLLPKNSPLATGSASVAPPASPRVTITDLGARPNTDDGANGFSINNSGQIAGTVDGTLFRWTPSERFVLMGMPAQRPAIHPGYAQIVDGNLGWTPTHGFFHIPCRAQGINKFGTVIGLTTVNDNFGSHEAPCTWHSGTGAKALVVPLGGDYQTAFVSVNDAGDVLAYVFFADIAGDCLYLSGQTPRCSDEGRTDFRRLLNNCRQSLLSVSDFGGSEMDFVVSPSGGRRELALPPGFSHPSLTALNNLGYVAGVAISNADYSQHGFLWPPFGGPVELPPLRGSTLVQVNGMNDVGEVVGGSGNSTDIQHPTRAVRWNVSGVGAGGVALSIEGELGALAVRGALSPSERTALSELLETARQRIALGHVQPARDALASFTQFLTGIRTVRRGGLLPDAEALVLSDVVACLATGL